MFERRNGGSSNSASCTDLESRSDDMRADGRGGHKISSTAISLLIYAARFQDDEGNIQGLYYKEAAAAICCHPDYFYYALKSLEHHGLIEIDWVNSPNGYWNIRILDNVFQNKTDYKKGYVNINLEVLQAKSFHLLACTDKVVMLHILKNMHAFVKEYMSYTSVDYNTMPISYQAIEKWAGVSRQTAKEIAKRLSAVINITIGPHQMLVHLTGNLKPGSHANLLNRATDKTGETEAEVRNVHLVCHVLRLMKIDPDTQSSEFIKKIARVLKDRGIKTIYQIYDTISNVFWDVGRLSPRRLNYILRQQYA